MTEMIILKGNADSDKQNKFIIIIIIIYLAIHIKIQNTNNVHVKDKTLKNSKYMEYAWNFNHHSSFFLLIIFANALILFLFGIFL